MNLSGKQRTIGITLVGIAGVTAGIVIPLVLKHKDEDIKMHNLDDPKFANTKKAADKIIEELKAEVPDNSPLSQTNTHSMMKTDGVMSVIYGTTANNQAYTFKVRKNPDGTLQLIEASVNNHEFDSNALNTFNTKSGNMGLLNGFSIAYGAESGEEPANTNTTLQYQNSGVSLSSLNNLFKVADKYYTTALLAHGAPLADLGIGTTATVTGHAITLDGKHYVHYDKAQGGSLTTPAYFPAGDTVTSAAATPSSSMVATGYKSGDTVYETKADALASAHVTAVTTMPTGTSGDQITMDGNQLDYFGKSSLNPSYTAPTPATPFTSTTEGQTVTVDRDAFVYHGTVAAVDPTVVEMPVLTDLTLPGAGVSAYPMKINGDVYSYIRDYYTIDEVKTEVDRILGTLTASDTLTRPTTTLISNALTVAGINAPTVSSIKNIINTIISDKITANEDPTVWWPALMTELNAITKTDGSSLFTTPFSESTLGVNAPNPAATTGHFAKQVAGKWVDLDASIISENKFYQLKSESALPSTQKDFIQVSTAQADKSIYVGFVAAKPAGWYKGSNTNPEANVPTPVYGTTTPGTYTKTAPDNSVPGWYAGSVATPVTTVAFQKPGTTEYYSSEAEAIKGMNITEVTLDASFATTNPTVKYMANGASAPVTYVWKTNFDGATLTTPGYFETQPTIIGATPLALGSTIYTFGTNLYSDDGKARDEAVKTKVLSSQTIVPPTTAGESVIVDGLTYTSIAVIVAPPAPTPSMHFEDLYML